MVRVHFINCLKNDITEIIKCCSEFVIDGKNHFSHWTLGATQGLFADSVAQDQTAQNVQSDLGSTLSHKENLFSNINSEKANFPFYNGFGSLSLFV